MLTILLLLVGAVAFASPSEVMITGGKAAPSLVRTNDLIQEFANVKTAIMNKLLQLETNIQTNLVCNCENASRPTIINFDYQIFHNIPEPQGWTLVYYELYPHPTTVDELRKLAQHCSSKIMVGAQEKPGYPLYLAATGPIDILDLNTQKNVPVKYGDVWWYLTSGASFGFSPISKVNQNFADTLLDSNDFPTKRLSWSLTIGGYRAGDKYGTTVNSWRKVIYCI